jgi:hypothetical protein
MENLTNDEIINILNNLKSEFQEYQDIIKQAYIEMESRSKQYALYNNELKNRGIQYE